MITKSLSNDLFDTAAASDLDAKLALHRRSEDPYAYYSIFGDPEDDETAVTVQPAPMIAAPREVGSLSKKDFQDGCRRIFLQYVPQAERQFLPSQYRDFIIRNERRSAEERSRLLDALGRYDLSMSGNIKNHFNRVPELLTTAKLQQIERAAQITDSSK